MPQTPHVERHFTASEFVRDVVIGMSDGLTVPFALAAGLSGAVDLTSIIVTAGLAEVAAGLLDAPVALLDEYLDILARHGLSGDQEAFLDAAIGRARGHGPASIVGPFVEEEMPDVTRVLVTGESGVIGVLVAWVPEPVSPAQEAVLGELAEAVGLERAREEVRTETESRLRGDPSNNNERLQVFATIDDGASVDAGSVAVTAQFNTANLRNELGSLFGSNGDSRAYAQVSSGSAAAAPTVDANLSTLSDVNALIGANTSIAKLPSTTSMTNMPPAIGAL